jgi:hypothetical protein
MLRTTARFDICWLRSGCRSSPSLRRSGRGPGDRKVYRLEIDCLQIRLRPNGPASPGGLVVKPNPDLLRLQPELIDAVTSCTVKTATAAAFYTTPGRTQHQSKPNRPEARPLTPVAYPKLSGWHRGPDLTANAHQKIKWSAIAKSPRTRAVRRYSWRRSAA